MSGGRKISMGRLLWRRFRWPAALLLLYLIAEQVYVSLAAGDGLFFPAVSGQRQGVIALGLAVILLRLLVLGLLPGIFTYKIVMTVWNRLRPPPVA